MVKITVFLCLPRSISSLSGSVCKYGSVSQTVLLPVCLSARLVHLLCLPSDHTFIYGSITSGVLLLCAPHAWGLVHGVHSLYFRAISWIWKVVVFDERYKIRPEKAT